MSWDMQISFERRTGVYSPTEPINCNEHTFESGMKYPVRILGLLQDEDVPVFVCEFSDGFVMNIYTEHITLDPLPGDVFRQGGLVDGTKK